MEAIIKTAMLLPVRWIEAGAAIVIAVALVRALWNSLAGIISLRRQSSSVPGGLPVP